MTPPCSCLSSVYVYFEDHEDEDGAAERDRGRSALEEAEHDGGADFWIGVIGDGGWRRSGAIGDGSCARNGPGANEDAVAGSSVLHEGIMDGYFMKTKESVDHMLPVPQSTVCGRSRERGGRGIDSLMTGGGGGETAR